MTHTAARLTRHQFPFFAQGAAQAIEDAAVLARCLANGIEDPAPLTEENLSALLGLA